MRTRNHINDHSTLFADNYDAPCGESIWDYVLEEYGGLIRYHVNHTQQNVVCNEEDLFQEGVLAVLEAIKSYDPSKGATLNTHITNKIKQAMWNFTDKNFSIFHGGRYIHRIMLKAGENPTIDEIMALGTTRKTAAAAFYCNLMPVGYGAAFNMVDHKAQQMLDDIEGMKLDYAKYLTEDECFAIEHYFGLNHKERITMVEIGKRIGKSRKAVSYTIDKALNKLRNIDGIEDHFFT